MAKTGDAPGYYGMFSSIAMGIIQMICLGYGERSGYQTSVIRTRAVALSSRFIKRSV